jgi:YegS/Rv2252/BmrU family lipid kinase
LILHNPAAGRAQRDLLDATVRSLQESGHHVAVRETSADRDATHLLNDVADYDRLLVAGGDGTINAVLNAIATLSDVPPLGIIPTGTSNVLAAELGAPSRPAGITALVNQGSVRQMSLGKVNDRFFAVMVGVGLDAHMIRDVDRQWKRRYGALAHVRAFFHQARHFRFPEYRVRIDGHLRPARSLVVANASRYGPRWTIAPAADLGNLDLQVCRVRAPSRWGWLATALALYGGHVFDNGSLRIEAARDIHIDGPEGEPVQADGDIVAALPARIVAPDVWVRVLDPAAVSRQRL